MLSVEIVYLSHFLGSHHRQKCELLNLLLEDATRFFFFSHDMIGVRGENAILGVSTLVDVSTAMYRGKVMPSLELFFALLLGTTYFAVDGRKEWSADPVSLVMVSEATMSTLIHYFS